MRCVLLSGVRRRSPSATLTPSLPGWPLTSITSQPQLSTLHSYLFNTQIRPQTFNELKNNLQLLELSTLRLKLFSNRDTVLAYVTVVICKIDFSIFQTTFEIIISFSGQTLSYRSAAIKAIVEGHAPPVGHEGLIFNKLNVFVSLITQNFFVSFQPKILILVSFKS